MSLKAESKKEESRELGETAKSLDCDYSARWRKKTTCAEHSTRCSSYKA